MMLQLFVLTLLSANLWPKLPSEAGIILCAAIGCICFFWFRSRAVAVVLIAVSFMGWHGHSYRAASVQAQSLPEQLLITIDSIHPSSYSNSYKVMAAATELSAKYRLRLSWPPTLTTPRPGEKWRIEVRLKPPRGYRNLAGFNYDRYLLSQHIVATGYVQQAHLISVTTFNRLEQQLQRWHQSIQLKLQQYDNAALLLALTLGNRDGLTQQQWQVLGQTGTAHLMAISGLHLGICFGWLLAFLNWGRWLAHRFRLSRYELPVVWPWWAALALTACYAFLSGLALPTQRALLFIALACLLRTFYIRLSPWRILFSVAGLLLLMAPYQAYSSSFWLSFGAVAAVLVGIKLAQGWKWRGARQLMTIQLAIILFMLPLQAGIFGQQSVLAPLVNLIALPWMTLTILPLALLGAALSPLSEQMSHTLLYLADLQLNWLFAGLETISGWSWQLTYPDLLMAFSLILLLLLGVSSLFLKRSYGVYLMGLVPLLTGAHLMRHYQPEFLIDMMDVGQGQTLVIRKGSETLLYDVGPAYPGGFNVADAVLNPYLAHQGIHHVQALILSHSDSDHAGAERYLEPTLEIEQRIQPEVQEGYLPCRAGLQLAYQEIQGQFLSPDRLWQNDNDDSCVLLLDTDGARALLTGDISARREALLVQKQKESLASAILLVPHHGSTSSSSASFIQAVSPQLVLVSAGYRNRWHFPSQKVVSRYQAQDAEILNTAELGQIRMIWQQGRWQVKTACQLSWPVWYRCDN